MEVEQLRAIEAECQRLRNRYCRGIDTYDAEAVLSVFTDDGIWDRPPGQGVLQGKAAIRAFLESREPGVVLRHVLSTSCLDAVGPDEARGVCYWTLFQAAAPADGKPPKIGAPYAMGEYHDVFARTSDGWKIAARRSVVVFRPA